MDATRNKMPAGKVSSNMRENMVSPAWKQAASVIAHKLVPITRIAMAAVSQAVLRHSLSWFFILRFAGLR